jgi:hypothetical protein
MDREVLPGLAMNVGYYRTWYGNQIAVDNTLVTPDDYSPYCVTGPSDPRLPDNVNGQQICGLYDINQNRFGQVDNVVTFADKFGNPKDVYNGVDVLFQLRKGRLNAGGGWNVGNSVQTGTNAGGSVSSSQDNCFVVDSPQQLFHCKVNNPYQSRIKLNGSYLLPWQDIQLALVYQNNPGTTYTTNVTYTSAQIAPTLGRPLSGNTSSVTIEVADPFTQFGNRITQLDFRGTKIFRIGGSRRIQFNFDLYNLLNASHVITYFSNWGTHLSATAGANWKRPTQVFDGRLLKFSAQFEF